MHYHNRYLTVANTNIGSNAYWTTIDTEPYALWKLIPESEMSFEIVTPEDADSPLVTSFIPADPSNYTACPNGRTISEITIHHTAGIMSINSLGALWQDPTRNASSHYGVRGNQVGQFVNERDIAWTNGHESNAWCVTIETSNSTGAPNWEVSDDTYYTLVRLVADIAKRNNLGKLEVGKNLTYHSFYDATECPGPYLLARMQDIADRANEINAGQIVYFRRHNDTDFLGISETGSVVYTTIENAKAWKIVESSGEISIYDAEDSSKILSVDKDGVTPILTSTPNSSMNIFGIYKDDSVAIQALSTTPTRAASNEKFLAFIDGLLQYSFNDMQLFDMLKNPDLTPSNYIEGIIPSYVKLSRPYFIKTNGGKYLTRNRTEISLEERTCNSNQFWTIREGPYGYLIAPYDDSDIVLSIDSSNKAHLISESEDSCVSIELRYGADTISKITSCRYKRHLVPNSSNNSLSWNGNPLYCWEFEDAYILEDNWLRLHIARQDQPNGRDVLIPSEESREKAAYINNDGCSLKFLNMNRWSAYEPYTKFKEEYGYINKYAYLLSSEALGKESITHMDSSGAIVNDDDFYWVAVGPNVTQKDGQDPSAAVDIKNMFALGTLDVVVKRNDIPYYIRCVVGDEKNATYDNGIYQTWKNYYFPNYFYEGQQEPTGISSYDGVKVVEFIGDLYTKFENTENTLDKYTLDKIIFYDNPFKPKGI